MITVKTRSDNLQTIRDLIVKTLKNAGKLEDCENFTTMVSQSVSLGAKNTKNLNSKDLARLQLCQLANMYGVRVELL